TADARVEQCVESVLESCEQLADDLGLVAEMIVEVSRADTHLVGDIRGGDVRFAQTVEHHQAGFDDPLARASRTFALRHDDRSRTSELATNARRRARLRVGPACATDRVRPAARRACAP